MLSELHKRQQQVWDREHASTDLLPNLDSVEASSGVLKFIDWLEKQKVKTADLRGIEMGCGKGRNVLRLAKLGVDTTGIDFSEAAIKQATNRATRLGLENAHFLEHDATQAWPYPDEVFDFALDCFASTDIESFKGRQVAAGEVTRVIKPGGYLLIYTLSPEDEFSREKLTQNPAEERNTYYHDDKFEKCFDLDELVSLYSGLTLTHSERVVKTAHYGGRVWQCKHHWVIFRKP